MNPCRTGKLALAAAGSLLWLATATSATTSCDSGICTLIGCPDMLTVVVHGTLPDSFTVEAAAPGQAARIVQCTAALCANGALFYDFAPAEVTVLVAWASGSKAQAFKPSYEEQYPNGRRCGAACRTGSVTIDL